jgi:hypothetical protein
MREPTSEEVKRFYVFMLRHFDAKVVDKKSDQQMKMVSDFLDSMGIMDKDVFLNRFTTTINRDIYIPFEIGVESGNYTLWGQMTILTHECQHVWQAKVEGFETFGFNYLTSRSNRAHYEAQAFVCDLETHFWRFGTLHDPGARAMILKGYAVEEEDITYAWKHLENCAETIRQGGLISEAGQIAIDYMNLHLQGIRMGGS